jgi:hypothetical protein
MQPMEIRGLLSLLVYQTTQTYLSLVILNYIILIVICRLYWDNLLIQIALSIENTNFTMLVSPTMKMRCSLYRYVDIISR